MKEILDCIIVDDDPMSITILESLIKKTDFLKLKNKFNSAITAASYLRKETVDIIYLDVEMPEMTGLELLSTLSIKPQVILTTSNSKYALDAFDYDVTDYLMKPIANYARFLKASEKAKENCQRGIAVFQEQTASVEKCLFVKVDSLLVKIDFNTLLWVEAYGDYVKLYTEKKMYLVYTTLRAVEEKLPLSEFMRVHRSYIIRLDKIENIDQGNLLIRDKIIPVSNTYKSKLMERIHTL